VVTTGPRDLSGDPGLAPLSRSGPAQPIDPLEHLSSEAKALVLGELLDMRTSAAKGNGGRRPVLVDADMAIRRVARGLYRYELRRADAIAHVDFDPTTGRAPL
jgi:hypothetical protein